MITETIHLLDQNEQMVNSFLMTYIIFTIMAMAASMAITGLEVHDLKPIPVLLYWFQMGYLFH